MSRTRRFLGAISLGYLGQALIMLTGLWLTPFLLHHIDQEEFGLWLVGLQYPLYLSLLDIGVIALLPRTVAYATGRAGGLAAATDLPIIIGQTFRIVLWQLPAVALIGGILFWLIPDEWALLRGPLGVLLLGYVILFPLRILPAILQGLQDITFTGTVTISVWLVSTILTVALVLLGWRLHALVVGWLVQQALGPLLCWLRLRTRYHGILPASLPGLTWETLRASLSQGAWVNISQIAHLLLNSTDIVIIGKLLGPAAIVPYVCTSKLITVLANQPQMIMQQAMPALSELRISESRERVWQVMSALSLAMMMMSGLVVCVVLVVNRRFVTWWVGEGQFAGSLVSGLFLAAMLLRHWSTTWMHSLFCFGYERRLCVTNLVESMFTISCTYLLVKKYGLIGGPLGTIVGVCLVSLPANLTIVVREVKLSIFTLLGSLLPWGWRFILLAGVGYFVASKSLDKTKYVVVVAAIGIALVYLGVMLPLFFQRPLAAYAYPIASRLIYSLPLHRLKKALAIRLNIT